MNHGQLTQFIGFLALFLNSLSAWFFCCVMGMFVFPVILDRAIFYIPTMIRLTHTKEVFVRGTFLAIGEMLMWIAIASSIYMLLYHFQPELFRYVTISPAAIIAWSMSIIRIIYRMFHFGQTIKRRFYYGAYMRSIRPEALNAYHKFLEDLDSLYLKDLDMLLGQDLPYMHRQSVLRKKREMVLK